jgi:FlaA1/EpsC-like NDP-sugar epimerase
MQINVLIQFILDQVEKLKKVDLRVVFEKQKKIIAISVIVLTVTVTYFFTWNTRQRMVSDTLYWEKQAFLAKSLLSEVKSEQEVINLLKQQAESSHRLILLSQGRDMVQVAKDYAQRMNVRLIKVTQDSQKASKQEKGRVIVIHSRFIKTSTVQIEAEAGYMNLVRYFDTLYRVAPAFVSVERLKITSDKRNPDKLRVSMELRFYSLS